MNYLLDTNTIIYFVNGTLPSSARIAIVSGNSFVSFITRVELLAWQGLQPDEQLKIEKFLQSSTVYGCEEVVILQTIAVKKKHKIKLPDAFIAATALAYHLTLLSRNLKDFKNISGLSVIDPFTL